MFIRKCIENNIYIYFYKINEKFRFVITNFKTSNLFSPPFLKLHKNISISFKLSMQSEDFNRSNTCDDILIKRFLENCNKQNITYRRKCKRITPHQKAMLIGQFFHHNRKIKNVFFYLNIR